jgi:hypothetical protein
MKISRTVTVTRVERTLVLKAGGRCPHCGAELAAPAKALPAAGDDKEQDEPKTKTER